jgi:hypothetical protein
VLLIVTAITSMWMPKFWHFVFSKKFCIGYMKFLLRYLTTDQVYYHCHTTTHTSETCSYWATCFITYSTNFRPKHAFLKCRSVVSCMACKLSIDIHKNKTGWAICGLNTNSGKRIFLFTNLSNRLRGSPSLLFLGVEDLFCKHELAWVWGWSLTSI